MTDAEAAWVAGLLEGEGSFFVRKRPEGRKPAPMVSVYMTDADVLQRLADVVGVGRVRPVVNEGNLGKKDIYCWALGRTRDVEVLCRRLLPFMGQRRSGQIADVLDACDLLLAHYAPRPKEPKQIAHRERTHCKHGHPFDEENTYLYRRPDGGVARHCRECGRQRSKRWEAAKRAG